MDKIKHISFAVVLLALVAIISIIAIPHNSQNLGGGYWYDKEGKRVFGPDIDIPPVAKILTCKGDYIIAEQNPNKEREEATYEHEYNYPYGRDTTYYWIIYKKKHTFSGPLLKAKLDSVLTENGYPRVFYNSQTQETQWNNEDNK